MVELQIEQPVEQSASDTSCQLSAVSPQLLVPCAWGRGIAASLPPRLQSLLQLDAAGRFQQYDVAFASLAREPLAGFFWRRDEFRFHTRFASRFHHRPRQAPHAEQEINLFSGLTSCRISCYVPPTLPMQLLASRAEFEHLSGNNNP